MFTHVGLGVLSRILRTFKMLYAYSGHRVTPCLSLWNDLHLCVFCANSPPDGASCLTSLPSSTPLCQTLLLHAWMLWAPRWSRVGFGSSAHGARRQPVKSAKLAAAAAPLPATASTLSPDTPPQSPSSSPGTSPAPSLPLCVQKSSRQQRVIHFIIDFFIHLKSTSDLLSIKWVHTICIHVTILRNVFSCFYVLPLKISQHRSDPLRSHFVLRLSPLWRLFHQLCPNSWGSDKHIKSI